MCNPTRTYLPPLPFPKQISVSIVEVDCVANKELCLTHKIQAFPSLKIFKNGQFQTPEYKYGYSVGMCLDVSMDMDGYGVWVWVIYVCMHYVWIMSYSSLPPPQFDVSLDLTVPSNLSWSSYIHALRMTSRWRSCQRKRRRHMRSARSKRRAIIRDV
ncbi:hypothetical protein EON65_26315 [archaeon]|nr:MAG: hypothetical protein EON65_26315 [archaeon]